MANLIQSVEHERPYPVYHCCRTFPNLRVCEVARGTDGNHQDGQAGSFEVARRGAAEEARAFGIIGSGSASDEAMCGNEADGADYCSPEREKLRRRRARSGSRVDCRQDGQESPEQPLSVQWQNCLPFPRQSGASNRKTENVKRVNSYLLATYVRQTVCQTVFRQFAMQITLTCSLHDDTKSIEGSQVSVQFKENTGFCIRCRQFKLLVVNPHNTSSEYCITCNNTLEASADWLASESRVMEGQWCDGQWKRIADHTERVQADLAAMEAKQATDRAKIKQALLQRHQQRRRAS